MQMDRLYPPGRVWWAVSDNPDAPTYHQAPAAGEGSKTAGNVTLYEVLDVEKVFGQVLFARDMLRYGSMRTGIKRADCNLSSHMPHTYDRVLEQLYPHVN